MKLPESNYRLVGKEYQFSHLFEQMNYSPRWDLVSLNFGKNKKSATYTLLDLENDTFRWSKNGLHQFRVLHQDYGLLDLKGNNYLIDLETGGILRKIFRKNLVVVDDTVALHLGQRFEMVDLKTGQLRWSRPGAKSFEGWMSDQFDHDWMYVVAGGLHGFKINSGGGWYEPVKTDYDATKGGGTVANIFLGALMVADIALGGGGEVPFIRKKRVHNIHTKPLIEEDQLFFANRQNLQSRNKYTGSLIWEQELPEELDMAELKKWRKDELLLVSKGYRYISNFPELNKQASFYRINQQTGAIDFEGYLDKGDIVINYATNDEFVYVLGLEKIYQLDIHLQKLGAFEVPPNYGHPLRVVSWSSSMYEDFLKTETPDLPVIIRTSTGLLALHPVTFEELWFKSLGSFQKGLPGNPNWQDLLYMVDQEFSRYQVDLDREIFWFSRENTLLGVDLYKEGKIIGEFLLPSDNFWFEENGKLIHSGTKDIQVLYLD